MPTPMYERSSAVPDVTWVIGGGSGIGRATAERLAAMGNPVAVSGRREEPLEETVSRICEAGGHAIAVVADVTTPEDVAAAYAQIVDRLGPITSLVFAAGTNVVDRWWETLTAEDFRHVVAINLTSAVDVITSVLPGMRDAGGGRIFILGSWAGWKFMSVASAAYAASKQGLSAIVESLNDQEGRSGIRATLVIPGEVETEIMSTRPDPPSPDELAAMLRPDDIAVMIANIAAMPAHVCVNEVVVSGVLNGIYLRDSSYHGPVRVRGGVETAVR